MTTFTFDLHNGLANRPQREQAKFASVAAARVYARHLLMERPRYREVVILQGDLRVEAMDRNGEGQACASSDAVMRDARIAGDRARYGTEVAAPTPPPAPVISTDGLHILKEGREATLATLRPDGWPQATVVNYVVDKGRLFFECAAASQKARNIALDGRVSLAMVVPYPAYGPIFGASLAGHALRLTSAEEIAQVVELWRARYPYMKARLDEDLSGFAFYAVNPITVTTLDYTAGLGHRHGG